MVVVSHGEKANAVLLDDEKGGDYPLQRGLQDWLNAGADEPAGLPGRVLQRF